MGKAAPTRSLAERLRHRIRTQGPIPFEQWMEACLYDPRQGYYMRAGRKTGRGPDADFVTPPTLHPFFGTAIGRELARLAPRKAPARKTLEIVEFGGGEGDLAASATAELRSQGIPHAWLHSEASPEHRRRQAARGQWAAPAGAGGAGGGAPRGDAAVLCEVLDAIPRRLLDAAGRAVRVGLAGGAGRPGGASDAGRAGGADHTGGAGRAGEADGAGGFAFGRAVAAADGAGPARWLAAHAAAGGYGSVLVVDYGDRAPATQVRAYRRHQDADPLAEPGLADITVPVDFAAVADAMRRADFREASFETLERFLLRHGVLEALNRVDRATPAGASSYLRLRQLLLPSGMGTDFKVAVYERA